VNEFYFEYPPREGPIYALPVAAAVNAADVARLPDGQLLSLTCAERLPPIVTGTTPVDKVPEVAGQPGIVWNARTVVNRHTPAAIVSEPEDWDDMIEKMTAVASLNVPWIIPLAPDEFQRLDGGRLAKLKLRVPNMVATRLSLQPSWMVEGEEMPILLVAHLGRCQ